MQRLALTRSAGKPPTQRHAAAHPHGSSHQRRLGLQWVVFEIGALAATVVTVLAELL